MSAILHAWRELEPILALEVMPDLLHSGFSGSRHGGAPTVVPKGAWKKSRIVLVRIARVEINFKR